MGQLAWDVPPIGRPFVLRGRRDVAVVLDEFTPTHLDAWRGRAVVVPGVVSGSPSDAPDVVSGDAEGALVARAIVVRRSGDVAGRTPLFGARRRRLDAVLAAQPPEEPLLGVVVDAAGPALVWVRGRPAEVAAALSAGDWRAPEP